MHISTNNTTIELDNSNYQLTLSPVDDKYLQISLIDKTSNDSIAEYSNFYSVNMMKSICPIFHNQSSIHEISLKFLETIQKNEYTLQNISTINKSSQIHLTLQYTLNDEKFSSTFKLNKGGNQSTMNNNMLNQFSIRPAEEQDIPLVIDFIKELAVYENALDQVLTTEEMLQDAIFGDKAFVKCKIMYIAEIPVGFFTYLYNFWTWTGRGIYLDDIYVKPEYRGSGIGKNVMAYLASEAVRDGCSKLEWIVLDWNEPSVEFYKKIGAKPLDEWNIFRVSGDELVSLANSNRIKSK